ncbi:hypothetical protein [Natrinema longum]|uniref:Uncharacterized protein n=1 Tax=Natrinema longum TaxID=370324 RepID=A0A8A2U6R2_9EURY|nr:hypothetical protein [Natrinema longum]MBZ6494350.1 hypothetical protein [Natrinema longum]QSW84327.1 hypothetical protein J0X27_12805 [Natrinema longum]
MTELIKIGTSIVNRIASATLTIAGAAIVAIAIYELAMVALLVATGGL